MLTITAVYAKNEGIIMLSWYLCATPLQPCLTTFSLAEVDGKTEEGDSRIAFTVYELKQVTGPEEGPEEG
ncbi:hypothetical protein RSAG8_12858, partial [Rhizoctonia solani AG-8 WAC10335]